MRSGRGRFAAFACAALLWVLARDVLAAADPAKVLRVALPRAESGFDPAQASEV